MASVYRCGFCGLGFEVGWNHYHQEHRNAAAATSLVCRGCGTWYKLDHKIDGGADGLYAWGGPVTSSSQETGSLLVPVAGTPPAEQVRTTHLFRPVREPQNELYLEGVSDPLELASFTCVFCNRKGALVSNWPEGDTICPRCRKATLNWCGLYIT